MHYKNYIAVLPILLVVAASGCTIPFLGSDPFNSNTPAQTGAIIEEFSPDYANVHSGEEVTFRMKVKNTGSLTLENGFAEVLGIDQVWTGGQGTQANAGEVFPIEQNCRHDTHKITLLPEDVERGTTGGEAMCTWKYKAPDVESGLSISASPRVRFYYSYKSSTVKTVTIAPREELKALEQQGKSLPMESYSKTKSPISVDIETTTPIRTYGDEVEFPVVFTVKNIGGGTVCMLNSEDCKKKSPPGLGENDNWNKVVVKIYLNDQLSFSDQSCAAVNTITFVGNDPQTFSCKLKANVVGQVGISQRQIEATAEYGYFIDKTTEVIVYPSSEPMTPKTTS
ncbi:MAG: hypothetical protein NTU57_03915 [Candidatus Aenigmarchaeota archaeon]|nr:hypothetical protein [Candidatus Aenigmarchaeota archaeon]